jgi:hypothetical protein
MNDDDSQQLPENMGMRFDFAESNAGAVLLKKQTLHFRVASADVRVEIDISSVNKLLPVTVFVDSGSPVFVTFPAVELESSNTFMNRWFSKPVPKPPSDEDRS